MGEKHTIIGVHITDRLTEAVEVQKVLTQFGNQIKTRLGLHEVERAAPNGLLLLEMVGEDAGINAMIGKLNKIEGVEAKTLIFEHES